MIREYLGAWESVNGNPDVCIFRDYGGYYYLLAYSYDRDYGRGSFSCYGIDRDADSCYIRMGIKCCRLTIERTPLSLHIAGWGGYVKY